MGNIGLGQTRRIFALWQTKAAVTHTNHAIFGRSVQCQQDIQPLVSALFMNGIDGVLDDIGQRLTNLLCIAQNVHIANILNHLEGNIRVRFFLQHKGLANMGRQVFILHHRLGHTGEIRELIDHTADITNVTDNCFRHFRECFRIAGNFF